MDKLKEGVTAIDFKSAQEGASSEHLSVGSVTNIRCGSATAAKVDIERSLRPLIVLVTLSQGRDSMDSKR